MIQGNQIIPILPIEQSIHIPNPMDANQSFSFISNEYLHILLMEPDFPIVYQEVILFF